MSLIKSVVLFALIALVAGSAKPKPIFEALQPTPRAACAGVGFVSASNGTMFSSNYPSNYDANDTCEWFIGARNGGRIAILIYDMETEEFFDFITIKDGFSANAAVLAKLSGTQKTLVLCPLELQSTLVLKQMTQANFADSTQVGRKY